MARPTKRRPNGFRLPSGAVRLQVNLHPIEYRELQRRADEQGVSVSLVARSIVAQHFDYPAGVPLVVPDGKYQPRGFARRIT